MDDAGVVLTRRKLNVDQYRRMAEAGILGRDDRVELIEGELIDMAPIGQDHAAAVDGLAYALIMACGDRAIVRVQGPVRLDHRNEPQPDFAVLRPRPDRYRTGEPPGPADILLLIEVSDSSLRFDRAVKLPLYARTGVAEVWIVDLQRRLLDAYTRPIDAGYADLATHQPGDTVALSQAPEIKVSLRSAFD